MIPVASLLKRRGRVRRALFIGASWILAWAIAPPHSLADVTVSEGRIEIPTYPWDPPVRHPYFRATDAKNIYPYPMLDNLKREKMPRTWRTVVLENEYLRITFLPDLGGKIHEVLDKTTSKPMFYVNHVVKPGLIGQCGAWTSGGIEFNTGPAGHTVSAVLPVDVEILPPAPDGSRSVVVGEVERIYGTSWTVVVTLRPGRSFIEETIRIYNRTETVRPYYFWNCTAVPNTDGFRFIYPMALGTDHAGTTFYTWPISDGKDLSLARKYQDASSIFAYQCDQDFFGSYDEDADRGIVACANHHLVPGKKAWTWGRGSYGTMHQMDLTDDDGPYNEVQTGPLPTQADVGRLDPHEAVVWKEWWYPVHGIGGFTFASRDVAVNVELKGKDLRLRMMGTGVWDPAVVEVQRGSDMLWQGPVRLTPESPVEVKVPVEKLEGPLQIHVVKGEHLDTSFRWPLDLPVRRPPEKLAPGESASELVQAGWQEYLFARHTEAESRLRKALERDPKCAAARTGLAYVLLDRDPKAAAEESRAALEVDPDLGPARFALAVSELRTGEADRALADAWRASLDPATAVCGRALAAKILIRKGRWPEAVEALSIPGPWLCDSVARNRLSFALLRAGNAKGAVERAKDSLEDDPLDAFARSILWLARREDEALGLARLISAKAQPVLQLAIEYAELGQDQTAFDILSRFCLGTQRDAKADPIPCYWAAYLSGRLGKKEDAAAYLARARDLSTDGVFPHRIETVPVLQWALAQDPRDGKAALFLGHLLFSLGRHEEGRAAWKKAAELGASRGVALRALGMAALKLDGDPKNAAKLLAAAHDADPADPIVSMDLVRVLFAAAEKEASGGAKNGLFLRALETMKSSFAAGKGRSDFVSLLARAQNSLGAYAETASLLDSVRITVWEGAREVHDLFEEAHLALGKAHLDAGRAAESLKEFERALEYPQNLATGRLENTPEAHIQYLRGKALEVLGRKGEAQAAWKKAVDEPPSKDARKEEARKLAREALEKSER